MKTENRSAVKALVGMTDKATSMVNENIISYLSLASCAPEWDFLFLLEQGILPQDLCARETYCN